MDKVLLETISDFVMSNRSALSSHHRQLLTKAGAKSYLDKLGQKGIEEMNRDSAGLLLDVVCAFLRRLNPDMKIESEEVLFEMENSLQLKIRLPRSDEYYNALSALKKSTGPA